MTLISKDQVIIFLYRYLLIVNTSYIFNKEKIKMEYIIGIAAIVILGYLALRMSKSPVDSSKVELVTPTPVAEAPTPVVVEESAPVVEAPAPVVVETPAPVVEAPAKKPRKPRAPKVEQAPVKAVKAKAPVAKTTKVVAKAPAKAAVKAVKAPAKKPAAIKATSKKA
jgi:hypothetical protein